MGVFLRCLAPVAALHSLALSDEFPLLLESDVHCREMPARRVLKIACTNDATYCERFPERMQFALAICCWIIPIGLLLV